MIIRILLLVAIFYVHSPIAAASGKARGVKADAQPQTPESVSQRKSRLINARELLGGRYSRSVVRVGESIPKINGKIYRWTRAGLPKKMKKHYQKIAQAIIDRSLEYELDPVLLLSIIHGESGFRPNKVGQAGEIGLMQIMPATGAWIAEKYKIPLSGAKSLFDPAMNIRIGAAYLSFLRNRFGMHARLYLAAYNMGHGNVEYALSRDVWPKDYPSYIMKYYIDFYSELKRPDLT